MLEKSLLLNKKSLIPRSVGVYIFLNKKKEFLYVGKSNNVRSRVFSYFKNPSIKQKKTMIVIETTSNCVVAQQCVAGAGVER